MGDAAWFQFQAPHHLPSNRPPTNGVAPPQTSLPPLGHGVCHLGHPAPIWIWVPPTQVQVRRDPDSSLDPSPLTNAMNPGEAQTFPKSQGPPFPDEISAKAEKPLRRQHWARPACRAQSTTPALSSRAGQEANTQEAQGARRTDRHTRREGTERTYKPPRGWPQPRTGKQEQEACPAAVLSG